MSLFVGFVCSSCVIVCDSTGNCGTGFGRQVTSTNRYPAVVQFPLNLCVFHS